MQKRKILISLIFVTSILGCNIFKPTSFPKVSIALESSEETYAKDHLPKATLANESDKPIYLKMGNYVGLEKFENGRWSGFRTSIVMDGSGATWQLAPKKTLSETAHFLTMEYHKKEPLPGKFRYRFLIYQDPKARYPFPVESTISTPFTIIDESWFDRYDKVIEEHGEAD